MRKTLATFGLSLLCVSVWDAFWIMQGQAAVSRSPADVHAKQREAVLQDSRQLAQAAGLIVPLLPAVRRAADALRREAAIDESAAQMLLVDDLLAKRDPLALAQAGILVSQTERLAGADSPAMAAAKALLAQASAQQAPRASAP